MIKIEIKNRFTGVVIFEYSKEKNNIKDTVREMLKKFKGEVISEAELSEYDLSGVDFSNSSFDNSRFDNSSFDNSRFYNSRFYNSSFDNSRFDNSRFYNSSFDNSRFDNSRFDNSRFYNSRFYNSSFDNSSFDNSRFDNSSFDNSRFDNSSFDNSSFDNSRFDNSRFYNSSFDNSRFDNSRFDNSRFDNSRFDEVSAKNALASGSLDGIKNDFFGRMLQLKKEVPFLKQSIIDGKINGSSYTGECACFMGTMAKASGCKYTELAIKPDSSSPTEGWFMSIHKGDTPENHVMAKITLDWINEFEILISNKQIIAKKANKKVKKDLNRPKKGVCPCCNRSFQNLHDHLVNMHPHYTGKFPKESDKLHKKINSKSK